MKHYRVALLAAFAIGLFISPVQAQEKQTCSDFTGYHHRANWLSQQFTITGKVIGDNCAAIPNESFDSGIPLRHIEMVKAYEGLEPPHKDSPVPYVMWYIRFGKAFIATSTDPRMPGETTLISEPEFVDLIEIDWERVFLHSSTPVPRFRFRNSGVWTECIMLSSGDIVVIIKHETID